MTTHGTTPQAETWLDKAVLAIAVVFLIPALMAFFRAVELGYFHK